MYDERKITQMILDVGAQFIELVDSEEERQTYLDIVCAAWNISILPKRKRSKEYKKYLNVLREKIKDVEMMKWLKEDLDGLIKAKNDLYPNEKRPIITAKMENTNTGKYKVTASFARMERLH